MKVNLGFEEKEIGCEEGFANIGDIWFNPDTLEVYTIEGEDIYDDSVDEGEELIELLENTSGEINCGNNEDLWRAVAELGFGDRAIINGIIRSIGY